MPLRNIVWLLMVPGLVGLGLAVGYSAPAPDKDYKLVRKLVDVLAEADANYVRELTDEDREQFIDGAINGGLQRLDKHSAYFNEKDLKVFETENEGSFGGIGIQLGGLDEKTKQLKVGHLMPGTPAYDAGLIAGDIIAKIGETDTKDMTGEEAVRLIKGEPGTKVTLTIRRQGKPEFPVTLTRDRIAIHAVTGVSRRADDPTKWNWLIDSQNKIGYVRVITFSELTAKELKAAIGEIEKAGGKGLIIDLRDNGGGLLSQAIEVSDLFLTEGKIVTTKNRRGGEKTETAKENGTLFLPYDQRPIVILVNHDTASASEIVAAALQDNKRAIVVGDRTYGKGSVQSLFRLPPDEKTAVKLTTQTWWRPSGKNMDKLGAPRDRPNEWGVTPDEGMNVQVNDAEFLRRLWELRKLDFVAGKPDMVGPNPPPPPPVTVPKGQDGKPLWDESKPFEDHQLERGLEYLRKKLSGVGAVPARPNALPPKGLLG
jgi:carboxyl-terminal processing protease